MTTARNWKSANSAVWPLATIVMLLALQFSMVFTRSINWDEFYWYTEIEAFVRGEVGRPLQTLHARLFAWLPAQPGNAVDHIVIARCFMFACEVATIGFITGIARRFTSLTNALLCGLAYISAGYVFQHGFSLRSDPMAATALTGALFMLARTRTSALSIIAFGLLAGMAPMITVKSVLYLPAFAGLAWLRWSEGGRSLRGLGMVALYPLAALVGFAAVYFLHAATMPSAAMVASAGGDAGANAAQQSSAMLGASLRAMFFIGTPPYLAMMIKSASISPVFVGLLLLSPFAIWRAELARAEKLALAGLIAVIAVLLFYRNTAAYFYVFALAPVAAGFGPAIKLVRGRIPAVAIAVMFLFFAVLVFAKEDRKTIERQHELLDAVHEIFPEPVAYFDHNGMLGGYRKMNLLMTPWGMEQYRETGGGTYRAAMESTPIPLLIENDALLTEVMTGEQPEKILTVDDVTALRNNYIRDWGAIWVAGKRIAADDGTVQSEFLIPGAYLLRGGALRIDGVLHQPGAIVTIELGTHVLSAVDGKDVTLRWADAGPPPSTRPPEGDLFVGF